MINIEFYLNNSTVNNNKLEALKELVQFFYSENVKIEDLSEIKTKLDFLKDDLTPSFLSLINKKIDLIEKDRELNLMFSFVFGDFKNYEEFSKNVGLNVKELRSIVTRRYNFCHENINIEEKLNNLERLEQEYRIKKLKLYDEFLWVYLNSRYYTPVVKKMTGVSPSEFLSKIYEYDLKENYEENIEEIIENKIRLLTRLKVSRVSDLIPIRDMELIKIIDKDVLKVSSKDYKKLEIVLDYLKNYGNIEKMSKNYRYNYELVLSVVNSVMNSDLINEETYQKLKNYELVHIDFYSLSFKQRNMYVKNMLIKYYKCNGNLVKLIENEKNSELVLRLLNDDIAKTIVGNNEYEKILKSLKEYSEKEEVIKIMKRIKK